MHLKKDLIVLAVCRGDIKFDAFVALFRLGKFDVIREYFDVGEEQELMLMENTATLIKSHVYIILDGLRSNKAEAAQFILDFTTQQGKRQLMHYACENLTSDVIHLLLANIKNWRSEFDDNRIFLALFGLESFDTIRSTFPTEQMLSFDMRKDATAALILSGLHINQQNGLEVLHQFVAGTGLDMLLYYAVESLLHDDVMDLYDVIRLLLTLGWSHT